MKIKCKHCDHVQNTRTQLLQTTCSNCGKKTPIVEFKEEKE